MAEPVPSIPPQNDFLLNGVYMVGVVRGIAIREGVSQATGNAYRIAAAVVEGDGFNQSRFTLTKAQTEQGWEDKISSNLVGKKCLLPVSITKDKNGYMQTRLRGDLFPKVIK